MKKPAKKSALIGLLIVVLAVAAGLTVWLINRQNETSTKDYASLQAATEDLRTSYDQLEKTFNAYFDETQTAEEKTALDKSLDNYETKFAAYKAKVDSVDEAKITEAYQAFAAKSDEFVDYVGGYIDDVTAAQALAQAQCVTFDFATATQNDADVVAAFDKEVQACQANVSKLKSSANVGLAGYGSALEKYFQDRRAKLKALQDLSVTGDVSKLQEAFNAFVVIEAPDLTQELAEARDNVGVIKQFEAMSTLIAEKTGESASAK